MDRELAVRHPEVDRIALRAAAEASIDVSAGVHGETGSGFRPATEWTRAAELLSTALGRLPANLRQDVDDPQPAPQFCIVDLRHLVRSRRLDSG